MQHAVHARLLEALRAGGPELAPPFAVPADHYRDPARLARELAVLVAVPRPVLAATALAPGACVAVDGVGPPALVVRDAGGVARAFANSCRHRATRLSDAAAPCAVKALVCPYHGWTYDLAGALIHVPHAEAFPGCEHRDLRPRSLVERHGLLWLGGDAGDAGDGPDRVDAFIGDLAADLDALDLTALVPWRTSRVLRACNWKLVVEAFLDGYHLRVLHRESIYRFFIDAASRAERVGPHIRAVSARRALRDAPADLAAAAAAAAAAGDAIDLHQLGTPSFVIFPATIVICHPDFVSLITLSPRAADSTVVEHAMLIPAARRHETEHWDRSWALIEDGVIQREDLWACEQIQRGLDDELLFGALECAVGWFHAALAAALESRGSRT